jgi:hypothetical protein
MTQVWLVQATVDCLGSEMVHGGILVQRIGLAVLVGTKLLQETVDTFPTFDPGKLHEMPPEENPGMQDHQAKKVGFRFGVAVVLEVLNVRGIDVHGFNERQEIE